MLAKMTVSIVPSNCDIAAPSTYNTLNSKSLSKYHWRKHYLSSWVIIQSGYELHLIPVLLALLCLLLFVPDEWENVWIKWRSDQAYHHYGFWWYDYFKEINHDLRLIPIVWLAGCAIISNKVVRICNKSPMLYPHLCVRQRSFVGSQIEGYWLYSEVVCSFGFTVRWSGPGGLLCGGVERCLCVISWLCSTAGALVVLVCQGVRDETTASHSMARPLLCVWNIATVTPSRLNGHGVCD